MAYSSEDIPDQAGKTIIVTGASSGIGLEATRILCSKGAHVIMACRNEQKSEPLASEITAAGPGKASVLRMDTTDLDSIDEFISSFKQLGTDSLDSVILNAGIMSVGYRTVPTRSEEHAEIESQMACNVVGHFYLAIKLQPLISASSSSTRFVTVSSVAADTTQSIDYDVFLGKAKDRYNPVTSYSHSKLGDLWLANELQRRFIESGGEATSVACHPGYSRTPLQDRVEVWYAKFFNYALRAFSMGADGGGLILACAATVPLDKDVDMDSVYFGPGGFQGLYGAPIANVKMPAAGRDVEKAKELWECCEKLCDAKSSF